MASLLSSTNLVEHAANDDIETSPHHGSDQSRIRLADRIAAIKPARAKLAQEAEVEINLPAIVPITSTALVPYRVTEALSLEALMRKPKPVTGAETGEIGTSNGAADNDPSNPVSTGNAGETALRVSEVPSLSAGTRLAELILEQRALIEDLTRLSQRVAAATSAGNVKALISPPAGQASDLHEPLDVVSAAIATYPAAEPSEASASTSSPSASQPPSRAADDMIRALAAVVDSRQQADQRTVTEVKDANNESRTLVAQRANEAYPLDTSTSAPDSYPFPPGRSATPLVHAPEPLTIASLIDEERPPMIIERAYTSLPEHELGRELPRAPGFAAGLALSGAAGLALFFALRVA